jgi:hypothetical protein
MIGPMTEWLAVGVGIAALVAAYFLAKAQLQRQAMEILLDRYAELFAAIDSLGLAGAHVDSVLQAATELAAVASALHQEATTAPGPMTPEQSRRLTEVTRTMEGIAQTIRQVDLAAVTQRIMTAWRAVELRETDASMRDRLRTLLLRYLGRSELGEERLDGASLAKEITAVAAVVRERADRQRRDWFAD